MQTWKNGAVTLASRALRDYIAGKRVALMMNNTAIDNDGRLLPDVIVEEKRAEVPFFFGMEHGVRGNLQAGNGDQGGVDVKTGLKIVNLYDYPGRIPPVDRIRDVDAVVFCAQDVGIRHWTFTPWMMALMDSCAKAGKEVIVLDRPNPIRGDIVEGECAQKYVGEKLVSGFEYPLRHGMTVGELALMYNDVRQVGAKLTVFKMEGWKRDMWYDGTGLIWLPPSPNMPTVDSPLYFGATGLLQSSNFSVGLKTTTPFQYVGAEDFCGEALARELNSRGLEGVYFVPKYYCAQTGAFIAGKPGAARPVALCDGVMTVIHDRDRFRPVTAQLHIIDALIKLYPDRIDLESNASHCRVRMCTDAICDAAKKGESILHLIPRWEASAEKFMERRQKYLLY